MKNMTKKIMALAMIIGFTNISAKTIRFSPTKELYSDVDYFAKEGEATWDTETNVVTTPSNKITYFDIQDIEGSSKNEPKAKGYTKIGVYGNPTQRKTGQSGVKQHYLLGKNYTR